MPGETFAIEKVPSGRTRPLPPKPKSTGPPPGPPAPSAGTSVTMPLVSALPDEFIAVPVISKRGHVIGGLFFGHAEEGKFTEESERLVAGVAAQAAIAIDNARLIVDATQSAERVRREEERYRTLVTATSQIVWSAAPDGAFTAEVPAWSELTGQTAAEQSGFGWLAAVHSDDRDRVRNAWQRRVYQTGTRPRRVG